jgi:tetraacyldisaccharide 4'-kinase
MPDVTKLWYRPSAGFLAYVLLPLSWVFGLLVALRRWLYRTGKLSSYRLPAPVIVVGNITVGGTGKTPLVIWLANYLRGLGYKPGIISRGYGGTMYRKFHRVESTDSPYMVGDEALLLARHCHSPVMIGADRVVVARALLEQAECNVIISDDGLQHYRLERDIEIAVVDGARRFGNQLLLPAGPLREPVSRLRSVDFVIINGDEGDSEFSMRLFPVELISIKNQQVMPLSRFSKQKVHAIAAIGNSERFFETLRKAGLEVIPHSFPDHYQFSAEDIHFDSAYPVIMTEKDAVKCEAFADIRCWYLSVKLNVDVDFEQQLLLKLKSMEVRDESESSVAKLINGVDHNIQRGDHSE